MRPIGGEVGHQLDGLIGRCRCDEVEFELGVHPAERISGVTRAGQAAVMIPTATPMPPIVSRAEWEKARAELLIREKELTRLKDSVSAARRRLPMVEITEPYTFDGENGRGSLRHVRQQRDD